MVSMWNGEYEANVISNKSDLLQIVQWETANYAKAFNGFQYSIRFIGRVTWKTESGSIFAAQGVCIAFLEMRYILRSHIWVIEQMQSNYSLYRIRQCVSNNINGLESIESRTPVSKMKPVYQVLLRNEICRSVGGCKLCRSKMCKPDVMCPNLFTVQWNFSYLQIFFSPHHTPKGAFVMVTKQALHHQGFLVFTELWDVNTICVPFFWSIGTFLSQFTDRL